MSLSLRQRIRLVPMDRNTLNDWARRYHYLHTAVHPRACPFGWAVEFDGYLYQPDGSPSGFIMFASVHFTKLRDEFGYPGLPTQWQVLSLARLWLHNDLPRNSESCVTGKALRQVQRRWLEVHPPKWPDEPYHVRKVISFCEIKRFLGTVYKATNFRLSGYTVSQRRHPPTRGRTLEDGQPLARYIFDLKQPKWSWREPLQARLFNKEIYHVEEQRI